MEAQSMNAFSDMLYQISWKYKCLQRYDVIPDIMKVWMPSVIWC